MSLTEISTEGVLGASYVNIDVSQSSGLPIENYGYLKSKVTPQALSTEDAVNAARVLIKLYDASKAMENVPNGRPKAAPEGTKR